MKRLTTDILVIGSGIAGLHYAIRCSEFTRVLIVTKGTIGESNTMYAQGGIAAVFDEHDAVENHINDTLVAGDGLCNETAVRLIAEKAKNCILDLCECKVRFDRAPNGEFDLHREGGHSYNRIVHAADATGKEVEVSLVNEVHSNKNISVVENAFVVDLVTVKNTCTGAIILNQQNGEFFEVTAKIVMLAAGGCAQVYKQNTNPAIATGDGFAMVQRAGATMANMEFVQFHPTTLYAPGKETFLISEAVRGFGAILKTKNGHSFMEKYHPLKSLAPRDIVTRAIINEMQKSGEPCVYLDLSSFKEAEIKKHFPNIYRTCVESGLNITNDMIPVVPAAHYMCGGVATDLWGRTSVENLYACGEVSCTGVHGANRLASNSLLEGLVFAHQASIAARRALPDIDLTNIIFEIKQPEVCEVDTQLESVKNYFKEIMWQQAGIIRDKKGLETCLKELRVLDDTLQYHTKLSRLSVSLMELQNMIQCGMMIVQSALLREESRGCHYRTDFPQKNTFSGNIIYASTKSDFLTEEIA